MDDLRILPNKQFDYVNTGLPAVDTNPELVGASWLNMTSGEVFFCTDNTADANVWRGQLGTIVGNGPYYFDPLWDYVQALVPMNDTNGSTTFANYGQAGGEATATTGTPETSNLVTKDYATSGLFATESTYVVCPSDFGVGDFCFETWFYLTSTANSYHGLVQLVGGTYSFVIRFADSGFGYRLQCAANSAEVNDIYNCSLTRSVAVNNWHHVAFTRESNKCKLWLDGVQQSLAQGTSSSYIYTEFTSNEDAGSPTGVAVGSNWLGNLQDARFTIGKARYSATFTPPTGFML